MKKHFFILTLTACFIYSCTPTLPEKDELFEGHAEQVESQAVQIAPLGSADVHTWHFKAVVDSVSLENSIVMVTALLKSEPWDLKLTIPYSENYPGAKKVLKSDTINVQGTKWSGGYEGGWNFAINPK